MNRMRAWKPILLVLFLSVGLAGVGVDLVAPAFTAKGAHLLRSASDRVEDAFVETFDDLLYPAGVSVLAARGNSIWYNRPAAARAGETTFFGWVDGDRNVVVARLAASDGTIRDTGLLRRYRLLDDHGSPALSIIPGDDGAPILLAAYARHNSELYVRRASVEGFSWEEEHLVEACRCTYPSLIGVGRSLFLFVRREDASNDDSKSYGYYRSLDNGRNWSGFQKVVDADRGDWVYAMPALSASGELFLTWSQRRAESGGLHGVFAAKSSDAGMSWSALDGTSVRREIAVAAGPYEVFRPEGDAALRVWDLRLDAPGALEVLVIIQNEDAARLVMIRTGKSAGVTALGENAVRYYPCGAVFGSGMSIYVGRPGLDGRPSFIEKLQLQDGHWRVAGRSNPKIAGDLCRPVYLGTDREQVVAHAIMRYESFSDFATRLLALEIAPTE